MQRKLSSSPCPIVSSSILKRSLKRLIDKVSGLVDWVTFPHNNIHRPNLTRQTIVDWTSELIRRKVYILGSRCWRHSHSEHGNIFKTDKTVGVLIFFLVHHTHYFKKPSTSSVLVDKLVWHFWKLENIMKSPEREICIQIFRALFKSRFIRYFFYVSIILFRIQ